MDPVKKIQGVVCAHPSRYHPPMFIGHFAVGFAAKKFLPGASLGTLFLAAQWVDLIWPIFVLTGLEVVRVEPGITAVTPLNFVSYPYSHSLLAGIGWGVLVGFIWMFVNKGQARAAVGVGLLVVSHWVLDFISHRPDMPLWPGGPTLGLGLWHSLPASVLVEGGLLAVGLVIYKKTTRAKDKTGSRALWLLVGLLVALYVGSLVGPSPPDGAAVAASALFMWLLVAWGYWIDRHRSLRSRPPSG